MSKISYEPYGGSYSGYRVAAESPEATTASNKEVGKTEFLSSQNFNEFFFNFFKNSQTQQ